MALEESDLQALKRPFNRADHEFVRGFVYLTEEAITNRIEEVDPSWTFNVNRIEHVDGNAVCHATLIINGVARDGIGMQQILEKAGEPAKGAATDALKRCARLFGIGRYLLDAPKEGAAFDNWLKSQFLTPPRPTPLTVPGAVVTPLPPPPQTGATSANGGSDELPQVGTINMGELLRVAYAEKLVKGKSHFKNLILRMKEDGEIRDALNAEQVLEAIRKHEAAKDMQKEAAS